MKKGIELFVIAFVVLTVFAFVNFRDNEKAIPFTLSVTQGMSDDCFFEVNTDGSATLTIDSFTKGEIIKKSKLSAKAINKLNNYIEQVKKEEVYKHETMVCGDIQKFVLYTDGKKYYMYWDGWFDGSADLLCRTAYILYDSFDGNITAKREFFSMVTDVRGMKKYSEYVNYWDIYMKFFAVILIMTVYICALMKLVKKSKIIRAILWIVPVLVFGFICGTASSFGIDCPRFFNVGAYVLCAFGTVVIYPIYYAVLADDGNKYGKILSILLTASLVYISFYISIGIIGVPNYINYCYKNIFLHYGMLPVFTFIFGIVINRIIKKFQS